MASSDIHGHIRSYDYTADRPIRDWGFSRLASLIETARAEEPCNILLDNGDFLQGTVLADLHGADLQGHSTHPMVRCFEKMGYDAIGLGNHEFNYGLDLIRQLARASRVPMICANALTQLGRSVAQDQTFLPPSVILKREVWDPVQGQTHPIHIGIFSVLPPQITKWDGAHLTGRLTARDMVETAQFHSQDLRRKGADLVIALAHTGMEDAPLQTNAENAASDLAQIAWIDAMITGHTHHVFPSRTHPPVNGLDPGTGMLHGIPVVMPGFRGSHLGVLDLSLTFETGRWAIADCHSQAIPVLDPETQSAAPEHPAILKLCGPAHERTLAHIQRPLGQSSRPIHSYFSMVRSDLPVRLVATAQRRAVAAALADTAYADLPLLSATAPYQTGGRAGPLAYCDIPASKLTLRNASDLYPFPNTLCAVRVSGEDIADWLERAASCFNQIHPGKGPQALLDPNFPGHAVDTLEGLTYRIDLTLPPRFDHKGQRVAQDASAPRIKELAYGNRPVAPTDQFIVALNNYRAFGGGPYAKFDPSQIVLASDQMVRDTLISFLEKGHADSVQDSPVWSFLTVPGAAGLFETGPGAQAHATEAFMPHGRTADGFLTMCLPLDRTTCESAA